MDVAAAAEVELKVEEEEAQAFAAAARGVGPGERVASVAAGCRVEAWRLQLSAGQRCWR